MRSIILAVGSVTYAIKLRKMLKRSGIESEITKLQISDNSSGCTYGVEISGGDLLSAVVIMKENSIEYSIHNK